MDRINILVSELREKNKELQLEMDKLSKDNLSLLDNLGKKFEWDEDLLKEWYEEYWHIYSAEGENEWCIAIPKFIPFSMGWLDHTTKGYNVFKVNQYTQWLGDMPDFLRKELNIKEPEKISVSDGNLIFTEGKEEEIKERYGDLLASVSKGTARVKFGKEFDLIAKIIENGSLPFVPREVNKKDIIVNQTNINFDGKYAFQKEAWDSFLKYGAIGIYWMTGCFDIETEILTKNGWKRYNELDYHDEFMTLNRGNNNIEYQKANKIFQYLYDGKMFNLETRQVSLNVTPNHNMFIAKGNQEGNKIWRICKPKDIFNKKCYFKKDGLWTGGKITEYFLLPKVEGRTKTKDKKIPIGEWVKFFGLWTAEGHTTSDLKGNYKIGISMFEDTLLNEMHSLLKSWGLNPNKQYRNGKLYRVECCNKQLFLYLKQFGKASQKYIPNEIKELSPYLLKDFLTYFEYGDGEHSEGVTRLITSSIGLRDDLQEIALKAGYSANFNILMRKGDERKMGKRKLKAKQDIWRITVVKKQNEPFINPYRTSSKSTWRDYKGVVWCVNVPNHIIYIRRNGKTLWSGNSGKDIFSSYALSRIKVKKDDKILPNLYVSPNLTILEQMQKEYFPKYAPELLKDIESGQLILSTYQGYNKLKDIEFGLTIFGECHVLPADTFSRLSTLKTKYRMGQCLDKNTLIDTPKGKRKIMNLKKGDKVITYNFKKQRYENKPLENLWATRKEKIILKISTPTGIKKIICSPNHKFYSKGKFIKAKDLSSNMSLLYIGEKEICQL